MKYQPIPGPRALPFLGTTWMFLLGFQRYNKMHEFYKYLYKAYGPIVKEEALNNIPIIHLFEPDLIKKVITIPTPYPLRPPSGAAVKYRKSRPDRYSSAGMINENDGKWGILRNQLTPSLMSPKIIRNIIPQVYEISDEWCDLIKRKRNSQNEVINMKEITDSLALELTCAFIIGERMGFLKSGPKSETAQKLIEAVNNHYIATRDTYFGLPYWKYFNSPAYKQLMKSEEIIYDIASKIIKTGSQANSPVLKQIMESNVDTKEKAVALVDYIAAGIRTIRNTFLFLLHLVGEHPVQRNIVNDDKGLTYSRSCLHESYRLYPTTSQVVRLIDKSIKVDNYLIPIRTCVVCHSSIASRNDYSYTFPDKFIPERWTEMNQIHLAKSFASKIYSTFPFGFGRRICPGQRFVNNILPVVLQSTVKKFEIQTIEPMELEFSFLTTPAGTVPLKFIDRNEELPKATNVQ